MITETFSPTADTVILNAGEGSEVRDANLGTDTTIPVGNLLSHGGNQSHALMFFDLSQIPFGSTIVSATLDLYQVDYTAGGPANATLAVWVVALPWTEGQATWNNFVVWEYPRDSFALAPVPFVTLNATTVGSVASINVTNIVWSWTNETYVNRGFLIWSTSESEAVFGSRDNATVAQQPLLTVAFLPGGAYGESTHPFAPHILNLGIPVSVTLAIIGLPILLAPLGTVTILRNFAPTNQDLLPALLVGLSATIFLRFWPAVLIIFVGLLCGWMVADFIPRRGGE